MIQGWWIDWLLWCVVVWSIGLVRNDAQGDTYGWWSLCQLLIVEVVVILEQFKKDVTWIERKDDSKRVVSETGDKSREVGEELDMKMEV